jgi:small-conductance mechanosensitive channel
VRLWDINLRAISALLVGEHFAAALFDISITILLAWALWGVIRISIERKLIDEKGPQAEAEEVEAGGLGGTRVETVLPLIRIFIKITLIVMAVLISLSALGVNIGPLIAGAGVVGIAIGFGAQTLVRDIVSGFFYLIDDAFRIGEYVVIDQIRGTVEKISVRSFQLRHHNGPVHTIPYGEIRTLTNWSRDWSIMKFELRIPFETDIEMVRKLIKKIGLEMMEDPLYGPLMLQPVKSQGVNRMDDSALIIRCDPRTAVPDPARSLYPHPESLRGKGHPVRATPRAGGSDQPAGSGQGRGRRDRPRRRRRSAAEAGPVNAVSNASFQYVEPPPKQSRILSFPRKRETCNKAVHTISSRRLRRDDSQFL